MQDEVVIRLTGATKADIEAALAEIRAGLGKDRVTVTRPPRFSGDGEAVLAAILWPLGANPPVAAAAEVRQRIGRSPPPLRVRRPHPK